MLLCRDRLHWRPRLGTCATRCCRIAAVVLLLHWEGAPGGCTGALPHMVLSSIASPVSQPPGCVQALAPVFPPPASCGCYRLYWDAHVGLDPVACPQPTRGGHIVSLMELEALGTQSVSLMGSEALDTQSVSLMGSEAPDMCTALPPSAQLRPCSGSWCLSFPTCPHVSVLQGSPVAWTGRACISSAVISVASCWGGVTASHVVCEVGGLTEMLSVTPWVLRGPSV